MESSTSSELDASSFVLVEGSMSFANEGVDQSAAEAAVAASLSQVLGLPLSRISTSAQTVMKPRRLSSLWEVAFTVRALPEEAAQVRERLQKLQNSQEFVETLRQELQLLGSQPVDDLKVSIQIASTEEDAPEGDSTELIIIVAAVAACLVMFGAILWKVCSSNSRESDELLHKKEEGGLEEESIPSLGRNAQGNSLEATYLGAGSCNADPGFRPAMASAEDTTTVPPEREFSDPPLPPPAESPPTHSLWSEVQDQNSSAVQLADVHAEVAAKRPASSSDWTLVDHQLNPRVCQALSCGWTGNLIWTELPNIEQTMRLPTNKEYRLTFQRGGRLVGHSSDGSNEYKITAGKHKESGEVSWREVPQSAVAMAMECQGRVRMRESRGSRAQCNVFEIVGVFTAVSTSISARHLGSGRFKLTTSAAIQPTALGNSVDYV